MNFRENFLLSIKLIVQFIVTVRRGQECVAVRYEQIENVDNLQSQIENVAFFN